MKDLFVIKYGGNAMTDEQVRIGLLRNICRLKERGNDVVIIHGGGPFIEEALNKAGIRSEFIGGQRVTSKEALTVVETTLKGMINADIVGLINQLGYSAVGLSGKDGNMVTAVKRKAFVSDNGHEREVDLGCVGDISNVNTDLLWLLLNNNFIPVLTCIASDLNGNDYNINADVFAGTIAGEMNATEFIVLTDVDGLMRDMNDPGSLITSLPVTDIRDLVNEGVIKGGMIPKMESCRTALSKGAKRVRIMNGTKPEQLQTITTGEETGTLITN